MHRSVLVSLSSSHLHLKGSRNPNMFQQWYHQARTSVFTSSPAPKAARFQRSGTKHWH